MKVTFKILDIDSLKLHESINEKTLKELVEKIQREGFIKKPIVVENEHYVILDGHHRAEALRVLGCKKIPAYVVNYLDDGITVAVWPGAIVNEVKKEEVIERGLKGNLFPPKTTKHIFKEKLEELKVDLKELY